MSPYKHCTTFGLVARTIAMLMASWPGVVWAQIQTDAALRGESEALPAVPNEQLRVFADPRSTGGSKATNALWVRSGVTTNALLWGLRGGLQFALHPAGFTEGQGGPRGLIRMGYPTLPEGGMDLINFIAVEPIVNGKRGLSELEKSSFDGQQGKQFWAGSERRTGDGAVKFDPGIIKCLSNGVEELTVTVQVEPFVNGAHVRLRLSQRTDAPGELRLVVETEPDSAPMESCILTATMGNKARTRLLFLKDGPVSSLQLYPDYKDKDFAPHRVFGVGELPRLSNGDVFVAVTNDEEHPSTVQPFGRPGFWDYRGRKVTQYWRKPSGGLDLGLVCAVNGRFTYWGSRRPIPGGIALENFELREPFRSGQSFIFGISEKAKPFRTGP